MLLARRLDERMWILKPDRTGAPFAISGQGHEAAAGGRRAWAPWTAERDWIYP